MYIMLYTVTGSLPLLCVLLGLDKGGVSCMFIVDSLRLEGVLGWFLFVICFVAFLVKLPIYMFHL